MDTSITYAVSVLHVGKKTTRYTRPLVDGFMAFKPKLIAFYIRAIGRLLTWLGPTHNTARQMMTFNACLTCYGNHNV